tara:strand:- start:331 stop:882 length:552 start_codon:yes stop_codon:yes gene_type:complete
MQQIKNKKMNLMSYYPEGIMLKKGAYNYPEKYIDFDEFILLMESDKLKEQIDKLRTYEYKSWNYNNAKRRLPVVLFNKFSCNLNTGFIEENPIKPFDVDLTDNTEEEIKIFEKEIEKKAIKVIKSPGGKGLKFFLKKVFGTSDPQEYIDIYNDLCKEIENEYNIILDYTQGRIKQPFFLTYIK